MVISRWTDSGRHLQSLFGTHFWSKVATPRVLIKSRKYRPSLVHIPRLTKITHALNTLKVEQETVPENLVPQMTLRVVPIPKVMVQKVIANLDWAALAKVPGEYGKKEW